MVDLNKASKGHWDYESDVFDWEEGPVWTIYSPHNLIIAQITSDEASKIIHEYGLKNDGVSSEGYGLAWDAFYADEEAEANAQLIVDAVNYYNGAQEE